MRNGYTNKIIHFAVIVILVSVPLVTVAAQSGPAQSGPGDVPALLIGDRVDVIQRVNVSLRENGRYAGHLQRERRLTLKRSNEAVNPSRYTGEYLATENTIHDLRTVASRVDTRVDVDASFNGERLVPAADTPITAGIPTIPSGPTSRQGWEAPAIVAVDAGIDITRAIPTVVAYQPRGVENYHGQSVVRIEYGYSLKWPLTPLELEEHPAAELITPEHLPATAITVRGNRQGVILLPVDGGVPVLHRTNVTEQIVHSNGNSVERRGFVLTWYRTNAIPQSVADRVRAAAIPNVSVEEDEYQRVRLSIRNLQFVADQDVLLPGEAGRLNEIASLLSGIEETTILVTGHTADVGSQESQLTLSIARARRIVEALVDRGIPPGRLRYEGRGGTQPIGDNTTEAGRARNRRVEITLLPN